MFVSKFVLSFFLLLIFYLFNMHFNTILFLDFQIVFVITIVLVLVQHKGINSRQQISTNYPCKDASPDCAFLKRSEICNNTELIISSGCFDTCNMCARTTYPPPSVFPESFMDCNGFNCHGNIGKEFYLMFLEILENGYHDFDHLELIITADQEGVVNIQCPALNLLLTKNINAGQQSIKIDKSARAKELQNEAKGIRVSSTVNITVYAMNMKQYGSEGYAALPVDVLGQQYTILTYKPTRKSLIGITATTDATVVNIHLNSSKPLLIEGVNRTSKGGSFEITMNRLNTFQFASTDDLSGTVISSNNAISVFTGNLCASSSNAIQCSHFCEQVPPIESWGRHFIVPRISNVTGSFIRIVAAYGYTNISVTGRTIRKNYMITDPNHRIEIDIGSKTVSVEASRPIYILLVPKYTSTSFNSFMISVPAIEQYSHYYHIALPSSGYTSHYMIVLIASKQNQLLYMRLDNNHLNENPTDEETVVVNGEDYTALTVAITAKVHIVTNLYKNAKFGLMLFGFGTNEAYGYPGGMDLRVNDK